MNIPTGIPTFESDVNVMWFDENGILCSVFIKGAILTQKAQERTFELIKKYAGDKKICWLGEISNLTAPDKETRDFSAKETPKFVKALAILCDNPFSNFIANAFFALKKPPYPTRIFSEEHEAKKWLMQFIENN